MPVPDKTHPTIEELQIRSLGQEGLGFKFHSLTLKLAGTGPQHLRQGIVHTHPTRSSLVHRTQTGHRKKQGQLSR